MNPAVISAVQAAIGKASACFCQPWDAAVVIEHLELAGYTIQHLSLPIESTGTLLPTSEEQEQPGWKALFDLIYPMTVVPLAGARAVATALWRDGVRAPKPVEPAYGGSSACPRITVGRRLEDRIRNLEAVVNGLLQRRR